MFRRTLILSAVALMTVAAAPAGLSVTDGWSRPAAEGGNGAGFLTITGGAAADRLVSAASPVAGRVLVHESMIMGGTAMMHPRTEGIPIPAGGKVEFKPGGLHLMLFGLKKPLALGEKVPLTLTFQKAGKVQVELTVRGGAAAAPAPASMPEHHH